ncbi:aldehyde dehydrogenase [Hortaea werneckii]|nr:aldehyde dehydrogenase [Hortaea werneckii]
MITRKVAPALAAGCAVVIKPPSETPLTALALAKLAERCQVFPNILHVCPTKDRAAASELATSSLVNKISFTGSTGVGKILAKLATGTLKKTCVCANRILVQKGVVEAFTQKLVTAVFKLKMGPGLDSSTTQGPLINQAAVDKVLEQFEDGVTHGCRIEIGGKQPQTPGFFCEPTVLSGAKVNMKVASDETFGPLAAIFEFDSEEDGLRLANNTEFGLAGYFFSSNANRCTRVARRMQVGMVGVNTGKISAAEAPFGGVKESGYGREGSLYGMEEYQVIKSITTGNLNS